MNNRNVLDETVNKKEAKVSIRRERAREKIRNKLMQEKDIKYVGPLSYRYLRIIAWISIFLGQLAFISTIVAKIVGFNFLTDPGYNVARILGNLAAPLFVIASFGLVLNNKRSILNLLLIYGAAFIGIGVGICLFYLRYIRGLLIELGASPEVAEVFGPYLGKVVDVNVFADLFCFLLFHFFVNYTPRVLKDKNILWFRFLSLLPVCYVITSYVFRIMISYKTINLPFYIYPFLTTKSPIVFLIFVLISLWIKNRERLYLQLGASRDDYQKFLLTNRNSLSFSAQLSILIGVFSFVELIIGLIVVIVMSVLNYSTNDCFAFLDVIGIGQVPALLITIPLILLYSYTRNHKNTIIDVFVPVGGIALLVVLYLESIYQLIVNFVNA